MTVVLDYSTQEEKCDDFKKQTGGKECTYLDDDGTCLITHPCRCPYFVLKKGEDM